MNFNMRIIQYVYKRMDLREISKSDLYYCLNAEYARADCKKYQINF